MTVPVPKSIVSELGQRQRASALRTLAINRGGVDLCSNDYLGLARDLATAGPARTVAGGATGSRLLSGNTAEHESLERFIADFHQTEAALIFGSGYEANLGLLSALGARNDTVLYDELVHASMRDGIRLGFARSFSFRHNDANDLREKLSRSRGETFVAVESLYSMDGHESPLAEILDVCEQHGAFLIVDEAHATGVYGPKGQGLVQALGLSARVFARIHTFGKALGYRGGAVVGPAALRDYLINVSRPFIYSTAPDPASLAAIRECYLRQSEMSGRRERLAGLVRHFREMTGDFPNLEFLESSSPIQGVVIPGNRNALEAEQALAAQGYFARAIRSPTVPAGSERLRLCLHAFNTESEIKRALTILSDCAASAEQEACAV